jgi:dolichyl-diphosphooligosaccharide--protein glycosyltransferase
MSRLALLALCALALYFRCSTIPDVFPSNTVNFVETDPWYHIRTVDNLVANFPHRMTVDPYSTLHFQPELATGPFFDYCIATIAWIAGLGHPSERLIHTLAAWFPAILAALIVPIVFLLGRDAFGRRAGLFAAAVVATLPGHFLRVGMVGYADHHVMESLLSALFFWLLLRAIHDARRALVSGLVLGAYLLTFVGGAFLVAAVVVWMLYEQIRSRWPRKVPAPDLKPVLATFFVALCIVAPFHDLLWMNYTIAALSGGMIALAAVTLWSQRIQSQMIFFSGLVASAAAIIALVLRVAPGAFRILYRLAPSLAGRTGGVAELQSLIFRNGRFTWSPMWYEFAGAIVLTLAGVILLTEIAITRPDPRRNLILLWTLVTLPLAAGQVRMTYYLAIAVALVSGYVLDSMWSAASYTRWSAAVGGVVFVLAPNLVQATEVRPAQSVDSDWRETLAWLRANSPEPFSDPHFYLARYSFNSPQGSYSVMAWWDYGYWITALGRRVPVSNPTQINADTAADVLLSQDESEAAEIMERWRARYLVVDSSLPMLSDEQNTIGKFPNLFFYASDRSLDDYYLIVHQRGAARILYRPAYFRSMLVRLFLYGGESLEKPGGAAVAYLRDNELVDLHEFPTEELARAEEKRCSFSGCLMVSENPFKSCVRIEPLTRFRAAFASKTESVKNELQKVRTNVQMYEFK